MHFVTFFDQVDKLINNWTESLSAKRRFFMMGNALVTGIIERLAKSIKEL
jgi:hypothetical protein